MTTVTVVTPCLNPGWRLQRCLDSVAAQDYPHIEHVVVDAGSHDDTLETLRRSKTRWLSEPDEGQSDAINKGFRLAGGEILTWLNADDVFLPGAVTATVKAFGDAEAGWTYGDVRVEGQGRARLLRPPARLHPRHFAVSNPLGQPGTFFRRTALDLVGELDTSLHFSMDVDLWLRLLAHDIPGVHIGAAVAVFEVHDQSKGGSVSFAAFAAEISVACLRNGFDDMAAAYLGRAAAHRAADSGGFRWSDVRRELDALRTLHALEGVDLHRSETSARVQLALLSARTRHLRGVQGALRLDVWRDNLARGLLIHAGRRRLAAAN